MAGTILHFGQEVAPCFPLIRQAGYSIRCYEKAYEFGHALQSKVDHQAVSLCDVEENVSRLIIHTARAYSRAPLILFRTRNVISFPAGEKELPRKAEISDSNFDLVIPTLTSPSTWLSTFDEVIARSREIREQSRRIQMKSASLCRETASLIEKNRVEVRRAQAERQRGASIATASASLADKNLICKICGEEFVFTAGEQLFFQLRNFVNIPKHCKKCKSALQGASPARRRETAVKCAECGVSTTVPFNPTRGRPVLCRACFDKK
jgi:CxxC-x17-CxxC domain-containing protein